jgi:hypothetical protein
MPYNPQTSYHGDIYLNRGISEGIGNLAKLFAGMALAQSGSGPDAALGATNTSPASQQFTGHGTPTFLDRLNSGLKAASTSVGGLLDQQEKQAEEWKRESQMGKAATTFFKALGEEGQKKTGYTSEQFDTLAPRDRFGVVEGFMRGVQAEDAMSKNAAQKGEAAALDSFQKQMRGMRPAQEGTTLPNLMTAPPTLGQDYPQPQQAQGGPNRQSVMNALLTSGLINYEGGQNALKAHRGGMPQIIPGPYPGQSIVSDADGLGSPSVVTDPNIKAQTVPGYTAVPGPRGPVYLKTPEGGLSTEAALNSIDKELSDLSKGYKLKPEEEKRKQELLDAKKHLLTPTTDKPAWDYTFDPSKGLVPAK